MGLASENLDIGERLRFIQKNPHFSLSLLRLATFSCPFCPLKAPKGLTRFFFFIWRAIFDHFGTTSRALHSENRRLPCQMPCPRSTLSGYTYEPSWLRKSLAEEVSIVLFRPFLRLPWRFARLYGLKRALDFTYLNQMTLVVPPLE